MTDIDRVRSLVRELYRELGLDGSQAKPKKPPVEVRYDEGPNGGTWKIDLDEDGAEVHRVLIPNTRPAHGLEPTGGI